VPAAAVIPAPIAYIKIVAVKKLVVGSAAFGYWSFYSECTSRPGLPRWYSYWCPSMGVNWDQHVYFEKIRVLKAGVSPE
jgi:hypothetical protein